jgi:hypothetical protein
MPTKDKKLYSFFEFKYFNGLLSGVLVLTQNLRKWEVLCLFSPIWWRAWYDTDHTSLM